MRILTPQLTLVDQVYEAILADISAGKFGGDQRLIQEDIAALLGVSRQPVQQALLLLRSQGLLRDAPGRGLMVGPLDAQHVRNLYEIRAMLDGLASRNGATRARAVAKTDGPAYVERGRAAVKSRSIARMIAADMEFHFFLYGLSGNPLVAEVSSPHWSYLRRVMGEVLLFGETPRDIWDQHEAILEAVIAGNASEAERLAREHISLAADTLSSRMTDREQIATEPTPIRAQRKPKKLTGSNGK